MVERIVILLLIAGVVAGTWWLFRLRAAATVKTLQTMRPFGDLVPAGRPAVVAFSSPGCGECRSRQAPALDRLAHATGDTVAIVRLNAHDYPELVEKLNILTVPATAVLDAQGGLRFLNLGFVDERKLIDQLSGGTPAVPDVAALA